MSYNMSFLMAAFILLVLICYHFLSRQKLHDRNSRTFSRFMVLGILDTGFDLVTTAMISDGEPDFTGMTHLLLTVFYLLQVLVPYSLFVYTWSLCEQTTNAEKILKRILAVPAVLMVCLVLVNVKTGVFFRIDSMGEYVRGPLYPGMYLYAFAYGLIILVCSLGRFPKLGWKKLVIILEFLIIMGVCVGIQAVWNELLMTGFGLMLGILVLYLTLSNPSDYADALTGMPNNRSFRGHMRQLYEHHKTFHIMMVDLPQMRQINMLFGSRFGDRVLCSFAEEVKKIPEMAHAFKVSGKRFAIISPSLYEYEAVRKLVTDFFKKMQQDGQERIQISGIICGILNGQEMGDYDTLVSYGDYLVSLVPATSETIFLQGDENTRRGFLNRKEVEKYLRTAIEEDLFELYYQPVFSLEKNTYVTMEALSRLRHPALGPVSPDVFISIAERNGQIGQIGKLQFRRLCRFIQSHPELMDRLENVKFNLSPAEILREGCSRDILRTIKEFGLPYDFFQFEITETVATEYGERLSQVVEDFRRCGIGLSLDDFGSGYANLDAVLRMSFSSIKLDRSLLNELREDEKTGVFYRSIVAVLKNMGYRVISEGVEEEDEVTFLRDCGVDMIQGYYFSKPLPPEDLERLLLNGCQYTGFGITGCCAAAEAGKTGIL